MTQLLAVGQESGASRIGPRRWRKHALRYGKWQHPLDPTKTLDITPDFAAKMKANFDAGVLDIVPVPARHTDDWRENKGETIGLEVHPEKGIYVTVQVDAETDKAIEENLLRGVSLSFAEDYVNKETSTSVGPVLRHTALTNVPYIKHLDGFERAVGLAEAGDTVVFLSEVEEAPMTKKEALELLKGEGIDVEALQKQAGDAEKYKADAGAATKLRAALKLSGVELSEDATDDQIEEKLKELTGKAAEATQLSERVTSLETTMAAERAAAKKATAEALVRPYLLKGRIPDAEKDGWISLAETAPEQAKLALKALSNNVLLDELGTEHAGDEPAGGVKSTDLSEDDQKEIDRLSKLGKPVPAAA